MSGPDPSTLGLLLELARRARQAPDLAVLSFIAVNDSHELSRYRQAALWLADEGVKTLSGVVQLEANAPYAQWLSRLCQQLSKQSLPVQPALQLEAAALPEELGREWAHWLPAYGLWLPLTQGTAGLPVEGGAEHHLRGGLLLAREHRWSEQELALLTEWISIWSHARRALQRPKAWWDWQRWRAALQAQRRLPWWRRRSVWGAAAAVAVLALPVRLTVLAPGELVPAHPTLIRAPQDGVIDSFSVKPNEWVKAGQSLFNFDDAGLLSRLAVAAQALSSAEAEYRQSAQLAVSETRNKALLAPLMGKVQERRAEAEFLQGQLERAHVVSPTDGIALFDDPSEWIGKPVATGERVLRVAQPDDVEIEAWLAVGDAIPLAADASVSLYLNASPLHALPAQLRYVSHDAVQRPDGSYAYRLRATLTAKTEQRIGLKGTAKLSGDRVPLAYWIARRPLAVVRQTLGW